MAQYLAMTIGPIFKTIRQAQKTRELWAASFLFSKLMEHLVFTLDPDGKRIILPRKDAVKSDTPLFGAGIYPDRLFMEAEGLTHKNVDDAITLALKALVAETVPEKTNDIIIKKAVDFWRAYLRIEYVLLPMESISAGKLVAQTSPYLDTLELTDTFLHEEPERNFLTELLSDMYNFPLWEPLKKNKGVYKGIMSGNFPSTDEIASLELWQLHPDAYSDIKKSLGEEEHEEIYRKLEEDKTLKHGLRDYHKYFCIVYADGDRIGQTIASLDNETAYREFSNKLSQFAADSAQIINDYGGKPVYIGGDDLLFLSPVYAQKGSILQLIQALDNKFKSLNLEGKPTLSFGVSITYYKYPLFESIDLAYRQLMSAKAYKRNDALKDAVGIRFVKHSGSEFGVLLHKNFLSKLVDAQNGLRDKAAETLLSSLVYKLRTLEQLLAAALKHAEPGQHKSRIENLLTHFFNDSFTGGKDIDAQKQSIAALVLSSWEHSPEPASSSFAGDTKPNWADHLYGALRLLKFITDQPKEK